MKTLFVLMLVCAGAASADPGSLLGVTPDRTPATPAAKPATIMPAATAATPVSAPGTALPALAPYTREGLSTDEYIGIYMGATRQDSCAAWEKSYSDRDAEKPPFQNLARRDAEHYLLNRCWISQQTNGVARWGVYYAMLITTAGYSAVKYLDKGASVAANAVGIDYKGPGSDPTAAEFWHGVRGAVDGVWDDTRSAPKGDGVSQGAEFLN